MKKPKFYVVWEGHIPGVYETWTEAKKQTVGFSRPKFKAIRGEGDAKAAFENYKLNESLPKASNKENTKTLVSRTIAGDYSDTKVVADVHIYCDGVCEPNPGECASGLAVYKQSVITALYYGRYHAYATNNIAELHGLLEALKLAQGYIKENKKVQILADSLYAINAVTAWAYKWKQKNWMKKKTEAVKNVDIIKEAHEIYDHIKDQVIVSHIKGHNGFEGNELADRISFFGLREKNESLKKYSEVIDVDELLK